MKKIIYASLLFILSIYHLLAQNTGIGTNTSSKGAVLDLAVTAMTCLYRGRAAHNAMPLFYPAGPLSYKIISN